MAQTHSTTDDISTVAMRKDLLLNDFLFKDKVLSEYEMAELLLNFCSSCNKTKECIEKLFDKFGSLNRILSASADELCAIDGLSENMATIFKIVAACAIRTAEEALKNDNSSVLNDWETFLDFCRQNMAYSDVEELRVFFMDENMHCFANKVLSKGTVNRTVAHPREIVKIASKYEAKNIILAHNHPSGDAKPSGEDISLTSDIFAAAKSYGIDLFDHLIVTEKEVFSFRNSGYIYKFMLEND